MKKKPAVALGVVIAAFAAAVAYKSTVGGPAAPAAPPDASAVAVASASSSATAAEDAAIVATTLPDASDDDDAGEAAIAHGASDGGKALPPLASGAAWSVVRWDMTAPQIEDAFRVAGVTPRAGKSSIAVKGGGWDATIFLTANKASQIAVTGSKLSKDAAASVAAKMRERGGAPSRTSERIETRWKRAGGGAVTIVGASEGSAWTLREEYVKGGASGAVGFAELAWGMSAAATAQALTTAGWSAHATKASAAGLDPCSMPNAPPDCAKKAAAQSVVFTKGEAEGTASIGEAGLVQVVVSGPASDKAAAIARAKAVEGALGKPSSIETSTKTQHEDAVARIELDVRERQPEGTFTVVETYRPKR